MFYIFKRVYCLHRTVTVGYNVSMCQKLEQAVDIIDELPGNYPSALTSQIPSNDLTGLTWQLSVQFA